MYPRIRNISFDCHDTYSLAGFWSAVLGYARHSEDVPGDPEAVIRDEEIERVLGLGATMVADRRHADGTGWAVLADPEGNEFCVLRSAGERVAITTVEDQP
ncbi:VOC family protein [Micromonospora sp. NPDC005194]|uniref:VOC family protein n=1 Tax=unclassified Micromonospora TaxID=2617518 RepID=UPI0033B84555